MKKLLASLILLSSSLPMAHAAETSRDHANSLAVGTDLSSFANNFGVGIQVASPRLLDGKLWFQLAGDYTWVQGISGGTTGWFPYGNLRLGVYSGRFIADGLPIRFYTGGGVVLLVNGGSLNSQSLNWGGFGLIGFEFFLDPRTAPFLELGSMGTGAIANQLQSAPIYANGFTVSWGFKWYL